MSEMLRMENITKEFGSLKANDNISLSIEKGEILALLGENGAGKSTLMNILYGLYQPNSGKIFFEGKEVIIDNPLKAIDLGIGMVHQHFMLIQVFRTWENVVIGLEDNQKYILNKKEAINKIREIAKEYKLHIDPEAKINSLSVGLQQQVELLKVLYRKSKLLILDEPTGVLTPLEKEKLFLSLKKLTDDGFSIIFISHKLDEVMEISDKVVILRRGKNIGTYNTKDITKKELARLMVGRDVAFSVEDKENYIQDKIALEVKNIEVEGLREDSTLKNLSFKVNKGEILGIAGVEGNGQSELMEAIVGLRKVRSGQILIEDKDMTNCTTRESINANVALVPEDRKEVGAVSSYSIDKNLILRNPESKEYCNKGVIDYSKVCIKADKNIKEYDIRISERDSPVEMLSGGNLQKVILARELNSNLKVLLVMHPTRGLDIGAIEFIHSRILNAKKNGAGVVLISSELEEILTLSDRIIILCSGKITGELSKKDASMEKIGMMMGGETNEKEKCS